VAARRGPFGRRWRRGAGSVYLVANPNDKPRLLRYRYNREFKATEDGTGKASTCSGVSGDRHRFFGNVPVGTCWFLDYDSEMYCWRI